MFAWCSFFVRSFVYLFVGLYSRTNLSIDPKTGLCGRSSEKKRDGKLNWLIQIDQFLKSSKISPPKN